MHILLKVNLSGHIESVINYGIFKLYCTTYIVRTTADISMSLYSHTQKSTKKGRSVWGKKDIGETKYQDPRFTIIGAALESFTLFAADTCVNYSS